MKKKISEKNKRGLVLTLIPTHAQKLLLDKHLNDTRFIYNKYVEEYLKALKEDRIPNYKDYKELCTEYKFLKGSYSWTLQQVLYRFKQVNKINRTKRSKGQKVGLVRFRSKKAHNDHFCNNNIKLSYNSDCKSESYVKISKIGLVNFKCKNIKSELLKAGEEFLKRKTLGKDLSEYKAFRLKDYRIECDNQMSELELQLL